MKKRCIKLVAILLTCAISIVSAVTAVAYSFDIPFKKEYNLFLSEYLINEDPFAPRLISGEIQVPCRQIVELKKDDPQWNWDVKEWTNATMRQALQSPLLSMRLYSLMFSVIRRNHRRVSLICLLLLRQHSWKYPMKLLALMAKLWICLLKC